MDTNDIRPAIEEQIELNDKGESDIFLLIIGRKLMLYNINCCFNVLIIIIISGFKLIVLSCITFYLKCIAISHTIHIYIEFQFKIEKRYCNKLGIFYLFKTTMFY